MNKNKKTTTTIVGEVIAYLLIAAVTIISSCNSLGLVRILGEINDTD